MTRRTSWLLGGQRPATQPSFRALAPAPIVIFGADAPVRSRTLLRATLDAFGDGGDHESGDPRGSDERVSGARANGHLAPSAAATYRALAKPSQDS
jgi:hypothetical protein